MFTPQVSQSSYSQPTVYETAVLTKAEKIELDKAFAQWEKAYKRLLAHQAELAQLEASEQQLETQHQQLETQHQQLESQHQQLNVTIQQLETQHQQLQAQHQQLETQHLQLNATILQLDTQQQQINAKIQQLDTKQQQLKANHQQLDTEILQFDTKILQLDTKHEQLQAKQQQLEKQHQQAKAEHQQAKEASLLAQQRLEKQKKQAAEDIAFAKEVLLEQCRLNAAIIEILYNDVQEIQADSNALAEMKADVEPDVLYKEIANLPPVYKVGYDFFLRHTVNELKKPTQDKSKTIAKTLCAIKDVGILQTKKCLTKEKVDYSVSYLVRCACYLRLLHMTDDHPGYFNDKAKELTLWDW